MYGKKNTAQTRRDTMNKASDGVNSLKWYCMPITPDEKSAKP
jgi:hypothetical protein